MIEFLGSLPPLAAIIIVALALLLGYLLLLEIGIVGMGCGLAALLWTRTAGWDPVLTGVAVILATLVGAVVHAILRPRVNCPRCKGEPREYGIGGAWRNCWFCGGSGQRKRLGAKILSRHRTHG